MDEPAKRHGPVAFEDGRTIELFRDQPLDDFDRAAPRRAKTRERLVRIRFAIAPVAREEVGVNRRQERIVLRERALDASLVALDLDVAKVAELLDCRQRFTWNAVPGLR